MASASYIASKHIPSKSPNPTLLLSTTSKRQHQGSGREWFQGDDAASHTHTSAEEVCTNQVQCAHCRKHFLDEATHSDHVVDVCLARPKTSKQFAQCRQCKTWVSDLPEEKSKHINICIGRPSGTHSYSTCGASFGAPHKKKNHVNNGCVFIYRVESGLHLPRVHRPSTKSRLLKPGSVREVDCVLAALVSALTTIVCLVRSNLSVRLVVLAVRSCFRPTNSHLF